MELVYMKIKIKIKKMVVLTFELMHYFLVGIIKKNK